MRGLYFEKFEVGQNINHAFTRTVTEADTVLFTFITMKLQPRQLDERFGRRSVHGSRIVNSL